MLIKLWKDFKKLLMFLPILCFIFLFKINNVSALVYKGIQSSNFTQNTYSGTLTNQEVGFALTFNNNIVNINNYDIVGIKFLQLNFKIENDLTWDNLPDYYGYTFSCTRDSGGSDGDNYCSQANLSSNAPSNYPTYVYGSLDDYNISFRAHSTNSNGKSIPCYFSNEMENVLLCPIENDITKISFYISSKTKVNYNFTLDNSKYWLNYESTEIVNGLTNVQQAQVQTATYIQNFNNYVSNTDTTQSNTNSTTALNGISSDFQQHLSGMNELTQFVFLPITFITSMIDSTCQPLIWDIPLVNTRVVVPCLSTIYSGYFGGIVGLFATVMSALLTYRCVMKLLATIKGLLDAEDDKIEVIDL